MPNTLLAFTRSSLSLVRLFWKKKKKELQHIVVFNIYKGRFLLLLEKKKKMLGTGESLVPFGVGSDSGFPLIPGVRTAELVPLARAAPLCTLHWQVPWSPPCCEEGSL